MNPDAYMPLYGDDFFRAVKGYPASTALGYLKAIWHYWSHEHGKGLRDDSEYLRSVCELSEDEWKSAQEIIFDNDHFFALGEDNKWHQKRASKEWEKAKSAHDAAVNGGSVRWAGVSKAERTAIGKRGAEKRWKGKKQ